MRVTYSHRCRRRRGAALIEFAIVAFVLLFLMFAGLEMDRMLFVYTNLGDATKAGIRYAITHGNNRVGGVQGPGNTTDIENVIKNYVTGIDKSTLTIAITYTDKTTPSNGISNEVADEVRAVVSYPYTPWVVMPFNVTLRSTSAGRIVY
jgi:Flp pilus assembly protein TadG